jgi:hypothetical protein
MIMNHALERFVRKPNTETPLLLRYQEARGGTLILEYVPPVTRGSASMTRRIDGVLVLDAPHLETRFGPTNVYDWALATEAERARIHRLIALNSIEVLQAKNAELGPYLLGQAYFSPRLIGHGLAVGIAGSINRTLQRLAQSLSVKLVCDPHASTKTEPRSLIKPHREEVERLHHHLGGAAVALDATLRRALATSGVVVDRIIIPDLPPTGRRLGLDSIRGRRVVAACSTKQQLGMYIMGAALCAQHGLRDLGAADVAVVILCKKSDSALAPLLREHQGIRIQT